MDEDGPRARRHQALGGLDGIVDVGDSLRVGAAVRPHTLAASRLARRVAPALAEAAAATSSPALRRRGTVGGNIVTPHPAGDVATALLALGATVEIADNDWHAGDPARGADYAARATLVRA